MTHSDWRALIAALPVAVYATNEDGKITFFNDAAVALWGFRPATGEAAWAGPCALFRPDGSSMPYDESPLGAALRQSRAVKDVEAVVERQDGTRTRVLASATPLHEGGRVVGVVNTLTDIAGRSEAVAYAQHLASIIESSDDAIVSKDVNGIIMSWNPGAERLFGYTAEEAVGQPILIVIPPDRHDEETDILGSIRRGERVEHYETVRRRKDGTLIDISLTVSPITDASGRVIGASKIARDISARKQAERNAELIARELDHRVKNVIATVQAIARLTRARTLDAYVEMLTGRLNALARTHTLLAESRWAGPELGRLIEEILDPYRIGNPDRVRVSGPRLVLGREAVQPLAMALHELATNAAKYGALSSPGGRVAVEWSERSNRISIGWIEAGGPPVRTPSRRGTGSRMIQGLIKMQLKGQVALDWHEDGLRCRMDIPMEAVSEGAAWQPPAWA